MHRAPPEPGYYTVWYPAKIKSHLKEPKAYLLENKEGKVLRCTEQHIRPYDTPPRRTGNPSTPPLARSPPMLTANGWSHMITHHHKPETRGTTIRFGTPSRRKQKKTLRISQESTATDRWQKRNLRPTPPPATRHGENPRLTLSPTTSSQQSPDSELRRSSRIQARKSLSDTE